MTEETKKKRDELAEEYCVRPLPEALKNDLIRYKPDNLKIIQRLEYAAYKHGFDAGYQVAMDEANERIKKLREALTYYACDNKRQGPDFITVELHEMIMDNGKTARAALKADEEAQK